METSYKSKIYNNPYRILGVYANASIKDIKANEAKAKAFLNVGKEVSYSCDFCSALSPLSRTSEMMAMANSQLTLPNEKIKHALFWFVKATPLDDIAFNHLDSGNAQQAISIWKKKECFSSLLNISTLALAEGYVLMAVDSMMKLLETESYRSNLITAVTDETFCISEEELVHTYLNEFIPDSAYSLLESSTLSDKYKEYVKNELIAPLISNIEVEINKAKSIKNENFVERYNAGVKLMNQANDLLAELKKLLPATDMRFQIIADKLGLEILQCGIDYYNNSDDADSAHKAMKLQSYAQSIVVGQMAKDRCKQNTDILKKIIDELPPFEVLEEDKQIKKELALFLLRPNNIGSANDLMKSCAPYIIRIKEKIGTTHKYYLNISTQIVQGTLHNVIEEVNRAIDIIKNQAIHSLIEFDDTLKRAWYTILNMEVFDMEPAYMFNRFLPQKDALKEILHSAKISYDSYIADIDLRTEEEIYNSCKSLNDYKAYIRKYPSGKFLSQANYAIELKIFKSCKTKSQFEDYIKNFPNGRYIQHAIVKRNELLQIEEENKRRETKFYNSCATKTDYKKYLHEYPNGMYVNQAQQEIDKINLQIEIEFYNSCSTLKDYENYLRQYPLGTYREQARTKIVQMKRQEEIDYYNTCSSIDELKMYMEKYVSGLYYDKAKERIKTMELQNTILTFCFVVAIIVLIIALITC